MSRYFLQSVRRLAGRLFQPALNSRFQSPRRSLRVEPLEERRLLTMVASNAIFAAGSGQGVYGGTTTAAVTLTSSGSPIADGVVQFLLGGVSAGEADTNANGVASLNGISLSGLDAGTHASELKAVFAGYTTASHTQTYAACSVSTSVIIGRAQLTITANNQSKVYGAAVPTLTASYAGLVSGDTSASLTTQPTLSTSATSASRIFGNPYKITVGGAADSNYIIHYVTGTLTVTPAPLTITAVNETKAYGAALPALTASYAGFVNGDTATSLAKPPTLSTTATAHSHVSGNPYSITVGGAVNPNYAISYVSGTLTVTPAPLTITASDKAMLAGGALPVLTATYKGLVNGDTPASLTTSPQLSTTATSRSICGQYPINVNGAADADYAITQMPGDLWVTTAVGQAIWVSADPIDPAKSLLIVSGTSANDTILIDPGATAGSVTVVLDGKSLGVFSPTSRICVYGGGGNDTISVSPQVTVPAWLYAEGGNVQLAGGGGPTLLLGGPGNDTLRGGSGPTIMISGSGANSLLAGAGDTVLVGGTTAYDNNSAALQDLLSTWSSAASYAARVGELMADSTYPLDADTVFSNDAVDSLVGGSGTDLFFQALGDNLRDLRSGESVIPIS